MSQLVFRALSESPVQREGLIEFSICSDAPVRRYDEFRKGIRRDFVDKRGIC